MICEGCGAVIDPIWSWCPDCGGLLTDEMPLDLTGMPAVIGDGGDEPTSPEPFATEWASA